MRRTIFSKTSAIISIITKMENISNVKKVRCDGSEDVCSIDGSFLINEHRLKSVNGDCGATDTGDDFDVDFCANLDLAGASSMDNF